MRNHPPPSPNRIKANIFPTVRISKNSSTGKREECLKQPFPVPAAPKMPCPTVSIFSMISAPRIQLRMTKSTPNRHAGGPGSGVDDRGKALARSKPGRKGKDREAGHRQLVGSAPTRRHPTRNGSQIEASWNRVPTLTALKNTSHSGVFGTTSVLIYSN